MNVLAIIEASLTALSVINQLVPQLVQTIQAVKSTLEPKASGKALAMVQPQTQHLELAGSLRLAAGDLQKQAEALEALAV